jgi:hypothetical protein
MKIKHFILTLFSIVFVTSCGGQQMLKNNQLYQIWVIHTIHGETTDGEPFGDDFLAINYDIINSFPLNIKKIIAYYSKGLTINDPEQDQLFAKSLGDFLTLKDAQEFLLREWEYNEWLPKDGIYINELIFYKKGRKLYFWCQKPENTYHSIFFGDVDIYEIRNGKIIFMEHYKNADLDRRGNRIMIMP